MQPIKKKISPCLEVFNRVFCGICYGISVLCQIDVIRLTWVYVFCTKRRFHWKGKNWTQCFQLTFFDLNSFLSRLNLTAGNTNLLFCLPLHLVFINDDKICRILLFISYLNKLNCLREKKIRNLLSQLEVNSLSCKVGNFLIVAAF